MTAGRTHVFGCSTPRQPPLPLAGATGDYWIRLVGECLVLKGLDQQGFIALFIIHDISFYQSDSGQKHISVQV